MPNELTPMSTWTPKDGQTYEIVDAEARDRIEAIEQGGGGGGAVDSVNGKTGAVVLDAEDVGALPDDTVIPAAVTEQTVSGWGFTKNTGTYSKPSGGIPDSDIASAATWNAKGTYSKPSGGIPASDLAAGVIPALPTLARVATSGSYNDLLNTPRIPPDPSWYGAWNSSTQYYAGSFVSYEGAIYRCEMDALGQDPDEAQYWSKWFDANDLRAQSALTFDSTPTQGSNNPVTSGGVYNVLGDIETLLAAL